MSENLSKDTKWVGFFDGACPGGNRRHPGPTRIGAVLFCDDVALAQISRDVGLGTVNTAEYSALIALLEVAVQHEVPRLLVRGDSQLVIYQMLGHYRVKASNLKPFHNRVRELVQQIPGKVQFEWIPRDENQIADKLSKTRSG